jgi:hypothetical protein
VGHAQRQRHGVVRRRRPLLSLRPRLARPRVGDDAAVPHRGASLGGFTTFSSFSIQTLNLLKDGQVGAMLGNVVGSVVLGLIAAFAGDALARALWHP